MKRVAVSIQGISPLLQHRYPLESESKVKTKTVYNAQEDAETALYRNLDGIIYQPSEHIRMSLVDAAKQLKRKRGTFSKVFGAGAIIVEPFEIEHETQHWELDQRPVVIQKSRIVRTRPRFDKWSLSFEVEYDDTIIDREVLYEAFQIAGKFSGIGDYRPQKGGPFGRFIVTKFEDV